MVKKEKMKSGFLCITHVNIFSCSEDSVPPVEEDLPDGLGLPMADLRQLRSRKTLQSTGLRAICGQIAGPQQAVRRKKRACRKDGAIQKGAGSRVC